MYAVSRLGTGTKLWYFRWYDNKNIGTIGFLMVENPTIEAIFMSLSPTVFEIWLKTTLCGLSAWTFLEKVHFLEKEKRFFITYFFVDCHDP